MSTADDPALVFEVPRDGCIVELVGSDSPEAPMAGFFHLPVTCSLEMPAGSRVLIFLRDAVLSNKPFKMSIVHAHGAVLFCGVFYARSFSGEEPGMRGVSRAEIEMTQTFEVEK